MTHEAVLKLRRAMVAVAVEGGWSPVQAAKRFGQSLSVVTTDLRAMGVDYVPPDKENQKRRVRADKGRRRVEEIRDRRRNVVSPVATGIARTKAPAGTAGTLFPGTVKSHGPTEREKILKDGIGNVKIGGHVLVGELKGARIFLLTLEERQTCPKSCAMWVTCYGNGMQQARRWTWDAALRAGLEAEIAELCGEHDKVLLRLHVLGDFPDLAAVRFWAEQMHLHRNLFIYGFTAWRDDTPIGRALSAMTYDFAGRFWMRHSGQTGDWGAVVIDWPTEASKIGDMAVCPEQQHAIGAPDRKTHCGSCGLCWSHPAGVVFIQH